MTALLILNIMAIALAAAAWQSPNLLGRLGDHAKARAIALAKSRKVYHATFNAAMGRKPAVISIVLPREMPANPASDRAWEALTKAASFFGAAFGIMLIVTAIAALVVMPQ